MVITTILASSNPGKLKEIQAVLSAANTGLELTPQSYYEVPDAEETGTTFVENAIIKARHAAAFTGHAALADDSGLEVDALKGAPGIYSARYAGEQCNDEANNEKLLTALKDVPDHERSARFRCVLVFMRHAQDATPLICTGTWEGQISTAASGSNGFGYDPLFFIPQLQCTSAQLNPTEKNRVSHRAKALQCLAEQIDPYLKTLRR